MIEQIEFSLRPYPRGIHLIGKEILSQLPALPRKGLLHLLIKHTSAALALNENADPDVRRDLNTIFDGLYLKTHHIICTPTKVLTTCRQTPNPS